MGGESFYERAKAAFLRVCEADGADRAALLDEVCGDDAALRAEVLSLLRHDADELSLDGAALEALPAGTRVGGFEIIAPIGMGAMGVVYEARQSSPQRTVALKLVHGLGVSPAVRRRFEHESEALARLQHPGIAAIYEAGIDRDSGTPYFAMELVRGAPMVEHATSHGMDLEAKLELLAAVADAVQHAHQRGVIHRDLKPANILVDATHRPRVLDFGIARLVDDGPKATLATMPGQVMGTLAYMAPEQAAATADGVDARADVYALGAIGYELLAGCTPLDLREKPLPEALRTILQVEPRKLGSLDRRLRGDVETVIAKALSKEPARRYASAGALADDLRRVIAREPVAARPATTLYQLRTFARRRKGLVAAGGVVAATLVVASVVSIVFAVSAQRERDRADRRFAEVRAMANTMLFDLHDKIERLPGSTDARMDLVRTGLQYLDSIAADEDIDPELMAELAEGYFRIGDILGNPRRANLGDPGMAIESYEHSLELRLALPQASDTLLKIARTRVAIGEAMTSTERAADAPDWYGEALSDLRGVESTEADDLRVLAEQRLGSAMLNQGRVDEAIGHFSLAAEAAERLAADGDPVLVRRWTVALNELAMALTRAGREAEVAPHLERSLEVRAATAVAAPADTRAQRDLALVHHRLGDIQIALGQPDERLKHYAAARDILVALAHDDAENTRAAFDVFVAESKLAEAYLDDGDAATARHGFESARDACATLAAANPENHLYQMALTTSVERVGLAAYEQGEFVAAQEAYAGAIDLCRACLDVDPSDARVWTVLALAQRGMGQTLLSQPERDPTAARASLNEAIETLEEMDRRGMTPVRSGLDAASIRTIIESAGETP